MLGKLMRMALQPVSDALQIIDGLTEGELRTKAAARLGADIVAGMGTAELIEWYQDQGE